MVKGKEARTRVNGGVMEGAPDWYDTHLDELDFEWSPEDKLEIERYCEKIHKNIAKEEMTPYERCKANYEGKPKDRSFMEIWVLNPYAVQTLNCCADALKPVDAYRYPKLMVKANLATAARYGLDSIMTHPISYSEEIWGGRAKMIELGNPINVGVHPIKTMADVEKTKVPDPKHTGLYPGYLWAIRELRRAFDEYGLTGVMPLFCAFTPDTLGIVVDGMMGMSTFLVTLRKDPEVVMRCADLATEFAIKFGLSVYEVAKPDVMELCIYSGLLPTKGNEEWVTNNWAKIGKTVFSQAQVPLIFGYALRKTLDWVPIMYERGVLGPGAFAGGLADIQIPYQQVIDLHRERDLYISCPISDKLVLDGPISEIEQGIKDICDYGKSYPKFAIGFPVPDYWTPPAHVDALVAAMKKYGKS